MNITIDNGIIQLYFYDRHLKFIKIFKNVANFQPHQPPTMARGIDRVQQELKQLDAIEHKRLQMIIKNASKPLVDLDKMTSRQIRYYYRLKNQNFRYITQGRDILNDKRMQLQDRLPQIVQKHKIMSMM